MRVFGLLKLTGRRVSQFLPPRSWVFEVPPLGWSVPFGTSSEVLEPSKGTSWSHAEHGEAKRRYQLVSCCSHLHASA